MPRTEEQKVCLEPIVVTLGGKEYKIELLPIGESRPWRAEYSAAIAKLPALAKVTTDNPEEFGSAIHTLLMVNPDTIIDLFFKYAKDLNRVEIERIATEGEIEVAFKKVLATLPLARTLAGSMEMLGQ